MNSFDDKTVILTIRTDKPEAEIGLYDSSKQLAYCTWQAHRQLAETIHKKIETILQDNHVEPSHLQGIVVFEGPGSFTGLRIGMSVANALAYSLDIPVVTGASDSWIHDGILQLTKSRKGQWVIPAYGGAANITQPKK